MLGEGGFFFYSVNKALLRGEVEEFGVKPPLFGAAEARSVSHDGQPVPRIFVAWPPPPAWGWLCFCLAAMGLFIIALSLG